MTVENIKIFCDQSLRKNIAGSSRDQTRDLLICSQMCIQLSVTCAHDDLRADTDAYARKYQSTNRLFMWDYVTKTSVTIFNTWNSTIQFRIIDYNSLRQYLRWLCFGNSFDVLYNL